VRRGEADLRSAGRPEAGVPAAKEKNMSSEEQVPQTGQELTDPVIGIDDTPPTLNRAERRAQAKGKKHAPTPQGGLAGRVAGGGPATQARGAADKTRLPRTGHK